jgi:hypothetical protein
VNTSDPASIDAYLGEYPVAQLMAPLIANAAGTLVGAGAAARLAVARPLVPAMAIGLAFFMGGIAAVRMMSSTPAWFAVLDLVVAYLPMA